MDAAEYKHVVLGLIFLKYISDSFEERPHDPPEVRDGGTYDDGVHLRMCTAGDHSNSTCKHRESFARVLRVPQSCVFNLRKKDFASNLLPYGSNVTCPALSRTRRFAL